MTGAEDRFKRGDQAARKGNYEYAVELYLQGLTIQPKAADARARLHEYEALAIESEGGNPQGSVGAKMKSMRIQANIKKLEMQKKWDEAVIELERALRYQPRNASLLLKLAHALELAECGDGALSVLEEVAAYDKQNTEALRQLGRMWSERDDPEKAVGFWERLRMIKPDDKEASKAIRDLSAATMVKRTEERKSEAGDESFKALLKDEQESADLEKQAKVLRSDDDRREAVRLKMETIKGDPKNSRLWRELGGLYQELRDYAHALAAYRKAKEVNPHDLFADDKIGALKEQQADDRVEAMRRKVEAAEADGGATDELRAQLEKLEAQVSQFKIAEYGRRVKAHPTDYELKLRFGRLLLETGKFDQAIEQFQKSVKDPKFKVMSQNLMGQCFARKGVYAVAVAQYKEALVGLSDPNNDQAKEIRYNLAVASEEQGDRETALDVYQKIMAVDIGYRDVAARHQNLSKKS